MQKLQREKLPPAARRSSIPVFDAALSAAENRHSALALAPAWCGGELCWLTLARCNPPGGSAVLSSAAPVEQQTSSLLESASAFANKLAVCCRVWRPSRHLHPSAGVHCGESSRRNTAHALRGAPPPRGVKAARATPAAARRALPRAAPSWRARRRPLAGTRAATFLTTPSSMWYVDAGRAGRSRRTQTKKQKLLLLRSFVNIGLDWQPCTLLRVVRV